MDYEKLYKESLEKAKGIINYYKEHNRGDEASIEDLEEIFPELAESEDERIRKELVAFLEELSKLGKDTNFDRWKTSDCANWIAWLEKQGQVKNSDISQHKNKTCEENDDSLTEDEKIRKGIIRNLEYLMNRAEGFVKDELKKRIAWLEKQGEISTKSVHIADIPYGAKDSELLEESITIPDGCYAHIDDDKVIIKKRGKSKFKVGDWIMDKESKEVFYISKTLANTYKIVDIEGNDYHVPHYILEEDYDVWTIQDAKPGDVLYHISDNGIEYIVMTKGINRCNNVDSYFRYNSIDGFAIDIPSVLSAKDDSITPADKKQRDFLFQKMKEAGYEWDEEKKELKHYEKD